MKALKTILGVLAVAGLVSFSNEAFAQENGNRDQNGAVVRGPYHTNNSLFDNTFVGIGGGVQTLYATKGYDSFSGFGAATDVFLGKWFTPTVGARIGWHGLTNKVDYAKNYHASVGDKNEGKFWHNQANVDVLWNISNALGGYKETRTWDVIPYIRMAYLFSSTRGVDSDYRNSEYGAGIGILNDFRLSDRLGFFVDLSVLNTKNGIYAAARNAGVTEAVSRFAYIPSATLGLTFNIGKTGFERHKEPVVIPVPFTTDQYNSLKSRVDALNVENNNLKAEVNALKGAEPDTVFVGSNVMSPAIVYFNIDKATLTDRELAHLDFYVNNVIQKNADHTFTLTGSADKQTGNSDYNQKLSERRVNYIHDILVKKYGIAEEFIIKAEGDKNNKFPKAAQNRCVTIE